MRTRENPEWLTLSQVAGILGVHPSTIRAWSDKGQIPVQRTQGRHRRFLRQEVELWASTAREAEELHPARIIQHAVGNMRIRIQENRLENESWYQKLNESARNQYRMSGRVLVQGLVAYLSSDVDEAMAEAHAIGYEYASRGRSSNLDSIDAVRAFIFFRNVLVQSVMEVYEKTRISTSHAWSEMLEKTHAYTDQILISLLETYQAYER
ncbi:MAG TPA: helix-turn-helix domain-containing protein [Anaerolineales bacterium]|nr:helix-turn-helix domain-containing protein [Anaerolineales bacterium]